MFELTNIITHLNEVIATARSSQTISLADLKMVIEIRDRAKNKLAKLAKYEALGDDAMTEALAPSSI